MGLNNEGREIFKLTLSANADSLLVETIDGPDRELAREQIIGLTLLLSGRIRGSLIDLYDEGRPKIPI